MTAPYPVPLLNSLTTESKQTLKFFLNVLTDYGVSTSFKRMRQGNMGSNLNIME